MEKLSNKNLNLYKHFFDVAEELSFTKASEKLYISQPTLSYSVKCLEEQLRTKLFLRNKDCLKLTENGQILYDSLGNMFHMLENVESVIERNLNINVGKIVIGSTRNIADFYLSDIINKFIKIYPNIKIEIIIGTTSDMILLMEKNELNVMFDNLPIGSSKSKMISSIVHEYKMCFACNPNLFKKIGANPITFKELVKYDLVLPSKSQKRNILNELAHHYNHKLNPTIELPNSKLMTDLLITNDYVGYVIKEGIRDLLEEGKLCEINVSDELETNKIAMVYIEEQLNTPTKMFINFINKGL